MSSRSAWSLLAVVALCASFASAPAAVEAGACAQPRVPTIAVVPTAEDVIPRGEGILVQIVGDSARALGAAPPESVAAAGASMFEVGAHLERDGERPIPLRVDVLGPGVARLVPARSPRAGRWRVVGSGGTVELTFGATPAPPLGAVPALGTVETRTFTSDGPGGGGSTTSTSAQFDAAIGPPVWQGVIAYRATSATTEVAITARALNGNEPFHYLYADPGRCGFGAPGQSAIPAGWLVRVAFYDLWGRVSARGSHVRVR